MMLKPAKPFSRVVGISSRTLNFDLRCEITSSVILWGNDLLLKRAKAVAFSIVFESREKLNEQGITGNMLGWIEVNGIKIVKGTYFKEGLHEWQMVPGMIMKTYKRGFEPNPK